MVSEILSDRELSKELEDLKSQLSSEQKLRDELVSTTSHDLRSPIGAINIFCEILMHGNTELDESQKQSVRMIAEASEKLQHILEDVVEIARIHSGRAPRLLPLDFRQTLQSCIAELKTSLDPKQLRIVENYSAADARVCADPEKVRQALLFLLPEVIDRAANQALVRFRDEGRSGRYIFTISVGALLDKKSSDEKQNLNDYFPKSRMGNRRPGESHYTWKTCFKLFELLNGSLEVSQDQQLELKIDLPARSEPCF